MTLFFAIAEKKKKQQLEVTTTKSVILGGKKSNTLVTQQQIDCRDATYEISAHQGQKLTVLGAKMSQK